MPPVKTGLRDQPGPLALRGRLETKETPVIPENKDLRARLARQERQVKMARLAQLVALDQLARPALLEKLDRLVQQELQGLRDLLALPEVRDHRVPPGIQALLDRKE